MRRAKIAFVHIPRTGGTALGSHFYHQTRDVDPTYFFSFFGLDSSQGANRCMVEAMRPGDAAHRALLANRHFLESRVVMGHFGYDLATMLDGFELQFAAVVREPVGRSISLIQKYTGATTFGAFPVPPLQADPDAYWAAILRILRGHRGRPIPGLLPHENMMLFDGMSHLIGGTPLHTYAPTVSFDRVEANLPKFRLAVFERFNESVGALLRELEIPVRLDEGTNYAGREDPAANANHPPHYGAPAELLELVRELNANDVRLYGMVR